MVLCWMWAVAHAEGPSLVTADGGSLVLEHVSVEAEVQAGMAVVRVDQEFHNPFTVPVNATYLFPLPPDAAVRAMEMTCGERKIIGQVKPRDEARKEYEIAAANGQKAALLEQERPNLFRQSVASICPGEDVRVRIEYAEFLRVEDGHRELVFPTTVGPRYKPGAVPEPPFTTVPPHTVDVEVWIDEGLPVDAIWSDTHAVDIDEYATRAAVRTTGDDRLPNKDFHLAWSYAGSTARLGTVVVPPTAGEDGYISVTIEPAGADRAPVRGRELLFVIDESCSMSGEPFDTAAATVRLAMKSMRPDDTFNLVRFSSEASSLFARPQPVSAANVAAAEAWLKEFDGQGTEMQRGIVHSLDMPGDPARLRLVLLMTDGFIGNEDEILATVRQHLGNSRLFSMGIGSAVNRYLLDALASEGRGAVAYQLPGTPTDELVDQFYDRIDRPALTDLGLRWSGIDVTEVFPARIPDLFTGQPVHVVARYRSAGPQPAVTLTGMAGTVPYQAGRRLDLAGAEQHEALPVGWARRKVGALELALHSDADRLRREVTAVALEYHLVTAYTSLVAVSEARSPCGPANADIEVPSMLPEGVDASALNGLGTLGTGMGGGGVGGMGGLGARGLGSGTSGYGTGGGNFGAQGQGGTSTLGEPVIMGSLDRSLIDEVLKRHLNQLRYCYQRELTKNAALAGKITIKFTIAADGTVSAATVKSSTMANAAVEGCLTGRFLRMQFPAPRDGGIVIASYPLTFAP